MSFLLSLLIIVFVAFLFSEVFKHIGIPRVVGQILAGIFLGIPAISILVFSNDTLLSIGAIAEIGIVLLFFFAGLEINLREFKKNLGKSFKISVFNTVFTFLMGVGAALAFGLSFFEALIVGICLSVSATAVAIDFLDELGILKSKIGNLIIDAGAVDDMVELGLITAVLAIIGFSTGTQNVQMLLIGAVVFVVLTLFFKLYLIPFFFKLFKSEENKTTLFTGSLIIALLIATLSESFGFGSLIGALIAGILIRNFLSTDQKKPWETHKISETIHIISFGFLVPIFFVWVGLNTVPTAIVSNYVFLAVLIIIAFAGTIYGTRLGVLMSGGSKKEGLVIGWAMNAKGDVGLAVAALALSRGILSQTIFSLVVFVAIVSTIVSPIAFRYYARKYKRSLK